MKARHAVSSLLVVAAAAMSLAACGSSSSAHSPATSSGGSSPSASAGSAVHISGFKFVPATLTVKRGTRLTVANDDTTAHTATADDGHSFDTGTLSPGASRTITVSKPGTYAYHCSIHSFMHGTLVVQ